MTLREAVEALLAALDNPRLDVTTMAIESAKAALRSSLSQAASAPSLAESDFIERVAEEIRIAWVALARTQPNPKASWLVPWAECDETTKSADRAIAMRLLSRHYGRVFALSRPPPRVKAPLPHRSPSKPSR